MMLPTLKKGLVLVILSSACAAGCELIVDFDRTRIPVEGTDATIADATLDTGAETGGDTDAADADGGEAADASEAGDAMDAAQDGDALLPDF